MENTLTIDELKRLHDITITTLQVYTQKCQWHHEEFTLVDECVKFYKAQLKEFKKQIEALEPKQDEAQVEPKAE